MAKTAFQALMPGIRARFLKGQYGFLSVVRRNLAARRIQNLPTLSRTWMGHFHNPMPEVIEELEAEYQQRCQIAAVAKAASDDGDASIGVPAIADAPMKAVQSHEVPGLGTLYDLEKAPNPTDQRRSLQRESREAWLGEVLQQRREQEEKTLRTREAVKAIILDEVFLTLQEVARLLALSDSCVRRILDQEPGVLVIKAPGAKRAVVRVPGQRGRTDHQAELDPATSDAVEQKIRGFSSRKN